MRGVSRPASSGRGRAADVGEEQWANNGEALYTPAFTLPLPLRKVAKMAPLPCAEPHDACKIKSKLYRSRQPFSQTFSHVGPKSRLGGWPGSGQTGGPTGDGRPEAGRQAVGFRLGAPFAGRGQDSDGGSAPSTKRPRLPQSQASSALVVVVLQQTVLAIPCCSYFLFLLAINWYAPSSACFFLGATWLAERGPSFWQQEAHL